MKEKFQNYLKRNEKLIGIIAGIFGTLMFLSSIEILLSNIGGNSNIFIQPALTALNGLLWSLYGYSKKDSFVLIPNALGCIIGILTALSALF